MRAVGWGIVVALLCVPARADDLSWQGFIDARLIAPPDEESWLKGGLGKLRYGSQDGGVDFRFAEAVGDVSWRATPELTLTTTLRVEPDQRSGVDALEAYARYRPQSSGDWQWSVKAGAFFPPISLENNDVGWTSPYTLTPSAIDSWVGDELRTIGTEAMLVRHTEIGTFTALAALYCCNDPAGVLIAERGWTFDDRPTGLFETVHLPDASLALLRRDYPDRTPLFIEIDGRPGWYGGGAWEVPGWGRAQALYYDNEGNTATSDSDYPDWHTRFWSEGLNTRLAGAALLFQNIAGSTTAEFHPPLQWKTEFWSNDALASYDIGDWRLSLRGDLFGTGEGYRAFWQPFGEHGRAATAALSWFPLDCLRLTAEIIVLDAMRLERVTEGLSKEDVEDQFQLSARLSL